MKHRLKWTLEDGRKVYISLRGKIDAREMNEWSVVDFERSLTDDSAYSEDLTIFGQASFFYKLDIPYVRCKSYKFEEETQPIDETAFIIGGKLACEIL